MKTVFGSSDSGAAFKAHLAQETTTLATLLKVTLKDGSVRAFTDASTDIVFGGITYSTSDGYNPSSITSSSSMKVDNLEIVSILQAPAISETDLINGIWDYARLELLLVNYMDLTMGYVYLKSGYLGQVVTKRNDFTAELRGLTQALQQPFGRMLNSSCDANFCDSRCTLNPVAYTHTGALTSVTDGRYFVATSLTQANGYFTNGIITMTSGANINIAMEVRSFALGGALVLQEQLPFLPAVGDTFSIIAGCLKTRDACRIFGNVVHFRGFPDVPGQDRMISGT